MKKEKWNEIKDEICIYFGILFGIILIIITVLFPILWLAYATY